MGRFYFQIRKKAELFEDQEGMELPDAEAALEEGRAAAREILANRIVSGDAIDDEIFEIVDEGGASVARLPFKSAVRLR
jgi:hypothetical protein